MPAPTRESDRASLRAWARGVRATVDIAAVSEAICAHIAALPAFERARHVLLYAATESEVDVLPLARTPGKRFYLPRCAKKRRLAIHAYPCPLVLSRFGIREPPYSEPESAPEVLDFVVVPGLAFTREGARLGQGGGFYDRFLPRLRPTCITVGVVPSILLVETVPLDLWDVSVALVISEEGVANPAAL